MGEKFCDARFAQAPRLYEYSYQLDWPLLIALENTATPAPMHIQFSRSISTAPGLVVTAAAAPESALHSSDSPITAYTVVAIDAFAIYVYASGNKDQFCGRPSRQKDH